MLIITILLISILTTILTREEATSNAMITDGDKILFPFTINITKKPDGNDFSFQTEGKICTVNFYTDLSDCLTQGEFYTNSYILLIKTVDIMNFVHSWETQHWDQAECIKSHILHENVKDQQKYEGKISFWVDNEIYNNIIGFDFRGEKANYFLKIKCIVIFILDDLVNKMFPYNYLYWTSLFVLIISFATIGLWHIAVYRIYLNDVTTLQKVFTVLPFLKFLLSLMLFYYISLSVDGINLLNKDDYKTNTLIKVYLDTVITMLLSIFKTILWFMVIILAWVFY
jgi:hypothetical protein